MSYLLLQILVCLFIAGLIGALIGWWLRGGCKNVLRDNDDKWSAKYGADKTIWQGKIDAAENHVQKSLYQNNNEWDLKLRDTESNWESKVQGLVGNYDLEISKVTLEKQALEDDLSAAREEVKEARHQLSAMDEKWNLKLKEAESNWEAKTQSLVSDYDSKSGSSDVEIKALRAELEAAKKELSDTNDSWNLKLKDLESDLEDKVQVVVSEYEDKINNTGEELQALKNELQDAQKAQKELSQQRDNLNLKLKDTEAEWENKLQGVMSDFDSKISKTDREKQALKISLDETAVKAQAAEDALLQADAELFGAVGHLEECYDIEEIEGIGPAYGRKFRSLGIETTCDFAKKYLGNVDELKKASNETKIELSAIEAWSSMADLMKLPGVDGQYAEIMQVVGVSSREELSRLNAKTLHSKMVEYNASNPIVPEVPSLALILKWTKSPDSTKIAAALKLSPMQDEGMNECYEVEEIEGIGSAYGRKFRSLGIETTCDFAKAYLNNEKAAKKAADETGIDLEAIQAWASMADIMRLPGIGGQYAEIMQAVGVSSKDQLCKFDAQTLYEKMTKFNAANSIVPEVPSAELLSQWAITSDSDKAAASEGSDSAAAQDLNECYDIQEVEGIGPGYGKRFRNMGVNTTCDLANKFLRDNRAAKKASKKMHIEYEAIKAWASMADLMRIPGVGGQFAEIMQTVGISSRKELSGANVNALHRKMAEFNAKKPIVPEVPSVDMLEEWVKVVKKY